jgi:hypothetical protein
MKLVEQLLHYLALYLRPHEHVFPRQQAHASTLSDGLQATWHSGYDDASTDK